MEDRTAEFMGIVQSLPPSSSSSAAAAANGSAMTAGNYTGRYGGAAAAATGGGGGGGNAHSKTANNPAYAELKQFHQTAAGISKDIAATSHMLNELTTMVRHKSLFVDDTAKVNQLVLLIKTNIENLNGRLDQAGHTIAVQKRRLGRNSQAGQEASNLVMELQSQFGLAAQGFKKVLQQRTDNMKSQDQQARQVYGAESKVESMVSLDFKPPVYGGGLGGGGGGAGGGAADDNQIPQMGAPMLDLTSGMSAGEPTSSASQLPRPHGAIGNDPYNMNGMRYRRSGSEGMGAMSSPGALYGGLGSGGGMAGGGGFGGGGGGAGAPLTPLDMMRMEQESNQQQAMQLIPDQSYLRERADAMSQVEANIVELGTIFNKLAVMVSEHRDLVQRVEDNVDEVNTNMTLSLNALTDTLTNLQSNRALAAKIFGILVAFIIIFIIFFA